jgi:type I restriction enzyme M protein
MKYANSDQAFLNELDKKLWASADKLRSNVNPGEYKDVVLGLIFLKYITLAMR